MGNRYSFSELTGASRESCEKANCLQSLPVVSEQNLDLSVFAITEAGGSHVQINSKKF